MAREKVRMVPVSRTCVFCGEEFQTTVREDQVSKTLAVCNECSIAMLWSQVRQMKEQIAELTNAIDAIEV